MRDPFSLKPLLPALLVVIAGSTPSAVGDESDINVMCPVLQDREADSDYAITYNGKEIHFCCSECVMEFEENPAIYENAVPQLQDLPLRHRLQLFMGDYGGMIVGMSLLATLIALRIFRIRNPSVSQQAGSFLGRLVATRVSPAVPLVLLCGYLGYEVWSLQHQLHLTQLEDELHYATFYDFGYPPVPRRADTKKRVAASFYRGNDERSPKLFNEGNYRTAAFHVSLCNANGQPVISGHPLPDHQLFVRLEVERPPFTPDFLYTPDVMNTMFLTAECDKFLEADGPVKDRVPLSEIEPMQRWEALFPVRRLPECCRDSSEHLRGTIYVCQEQYADGWMSFLPKHRSGSRFHYGICYDLSVDNDTLTAESDVYMGALYRTRKLPTWRVPMDEWFSHRPIPELPGENVSDPELLGITDHIATGKEGPRS